MKQIIKKHFNESLNNISKLHEHTTNILKIVSLIIDCKKKKSKILVVGNGGSAADAEHFTGELLCTYSSKKRKPISAISLSSNLAAMSAWANDFDYKTFYKRQVEAIGNRGDLLIILSTSGGTNKTSMNLVHAAKEAKKRGIKVISLLGKTGGVLKNISHIKIIVKSFSTAHIQEAQMAILNSICECLEKKF